MGRGSHSKGANQFWTCGEHRIYAIKWTEIVLKEHQKTAQKSKEILNGNTTKGFPPGNGFRSFAAEVLPELLGPLQNQQAGVSGHQGCPIRL